VPRETAECCLTPVRLLIKLFLVIICFCLDSGAFGIGAVWYISSVSKMIPKTCDYYGDVNNENGLPGFGAMSTA
jgi:hypothetical protein